MYIIIMYIVSMHIIIIIV